MPKPPPSEELLLRAARLYYEEGLDQSQVARQLGISRSYVSRLLTEARDNGLVEIRVKYPLATNQELQDCLLKCFGLQGAHVLAANGLSYAEMLNRLGMLGARALVSNLRPRDVLGIGWGTAIHATVEAVEVQQSLQVQVIQIIGGLGTLNPEIDGAALTRRLAEKLGGSYRYLRAPLIVESSAVTAVLLREPTVREVLTLAAGARIALVGIGTVDPEYSSLLRAGLVTQSELDRLGARRVVGDICCRQIDREGKIVDIALNDRVIGIQAELLKRIPVVLAVAGGIAKAPAILAALRGNFVKILVTDENAPREVLRLNDIAV